MALAALAGAMVVVDVGNAQAAIPTERSVATEGEAVAGTWVLRGPPSNLRNNGEDFPHGALPQGLLTIDTDGHYMLLLGCPAHAGDRADIDAANAVCRDSARGTFAHSGHLHADASRMDWHVDHSTVSALRGSDLRSAYALDGDRLTLEFDSIREGASAGIQGTVVWQRLSGGQAAAVPAARSSGECARLPAPAHDLDRSALNEARVDQ